MDLIMRRTGTPSLYLFIEHQSGLLMSVSVSTSFEMKVLLLESMQHNVTEAGHGAQYVPSHAVGLPTSVTFKRSASRSCSGMKGVRLADPHRPPSLRQFDRMNVQFPLSLHHRLITTSVNKVHRHFTSLAAKINKPTNKQTSYIPVRALRKLR